MHGGLVGPSEKLAGEPYGKWRANNVIGTSALKMLCDGTDGAAEINPSEEDLCLDAALVLGKVVDGGRRDGTVCGVNNAGARLTEGCQAFSGLALC